MGNAKTIFKNTSYNWINLVIMMIISFYLSPYVLHKIGKSLYGVWAVVTQITGYLWLLDFGVRDSVIKYVAEYKSKNDSYMINSIISSSIRLYSIICTSCIIAAFILAIYVVPAISKIDRSELMIARSIVLISGLDIGQAFLANVFVGILMGIQRFDIFSKINIVMNLCKTIVVIWLLSHGYGIVGMMAAQFISNTFNYIIIYKYSRKLLKYDLFPRGIVFCRETQKRLINYGFYVFLNSIGQQAIFYSGNVIIAAMLPVAAVTYYAIAANLVEYIKKLVISGTQIINPMASELAAKMEESKLSIILCDGTRYSLLLGVPIIIVYCSMGSRFIGLWMGSEFSQIAGRLLIIMSIMTLFSLPHYTIAGILLGLGKHRITAICRLIEAIANVCFCIILIKKMGITGCALGIAIPHLFMVMIVYPIIASRIIRIRFYDYFTIAYIRPLTAALPFAIICFIIEHYHSARNLVSFFLEIILLLPFYALSVFYIGLGAVERHNIIRRISGLFGKGTVEIILE
jgi:O-antigen/teichoic acid export membrane protein